MIRNRKQGTGECYRSQAGKYDRSISYLASIRERSIAALRLKPGETVVDIACGTGLSFELLEKEVGKTGEIFGVEVSQEMLRIASERVTQHGWKNVTLIPSSAQSAVLPKPADALLFHFTHDVMRSPESLKNIFQFLKPGGRVVATGMKWAFPWALIANLRVYLRTRPYVSSFDGFRKPWSHLEKQVSIESIEEFEARTVYLLEGKRIHP